jgi:hypothetical protein
MSEPGYGELASDIAGQALALIIGSAILLALALVSWVHFKAVDRVIREGQVISVPVLQLFSGSKGNRPDLLVLLPDGQPNSNKITVRRINVFSNEALEKCRSIEPSKIGCPTVQVFHHPGERIDAVLKSEFADPKQTWRRFWFPYLIALAVFPAIGGFHRMIFRRRLALRILRSQSAASNVTS